MTFTVTIIRGDDAHKTRCAPEFTAQWQSLAAITTHVTVFQEPAFVNTWYQRYAPEFEPVLVIGQDSENELIGFLPLAIEKKSGNLSHAAAQQVEYSGWLCHPSYKNIFISQAIAIVNQQISYSAWRWSHIPPHAEVDWLITSNPELKNVYLHYEQVASPILDLHNEEKIKKIKKSKSIKSKINRLKRKGDLHLEHITDVSRASEVMNLIPDLVNFRHGAAHGDLAFREDPLQHGFYQARAKNLTENHFSALWIGNTLLAFHFGGIDKDTIYIGLTAFDPRESKHSPGVIFILFLAEMMQQQGIRYIDLTPGGDEYKERFCNNHHTLYRPIIYSSQTEKHVSISKQKAKASLLKTLGKLGIEKDSLAKKLQAKNKPSDIRYTLFSLNLENYNSIDEDNKNIPSLNIQKYNDLLIHQGYSNSYEMQALLNDATQRFSKEETLFTLMEDEKLKGYGWLSKPGSKYRNHHLDLTLEKDQIVIDCIEIEKTLPCSLVLDKLMRFMISYAIEIGAKQAFSYIPVNTDKENISVIEKLGFQEKN